MSNFSIIREHEASRQGILETAHGAISTPVFMPIATAGSVKTLASEEVQTLGASIILANTYHLLLRPGNEVMQKLGGLHSFMRWSGPILTDSGGYQVFSLGKINRIDDDGVTFQSHIDGQTVRLTPESSIAMQQTIGADILMQFDDVAPGTSPRDRYEEAMKRSLIWAKRSKVTHDIRQPKTDKRLLFGIVQGGTHEDLREKSVSGLVNIGFDGYAIGGLSVGESREDTFRIARRVASLLPKDKPRYFMGGGMPEEIVFYVSVGIDMFDCVLPTRNARHGQIFVWVDNPAQAVREAYTRAKEGAADFRIAEALYKKLHITGEAFTTDPSPIDVYSEAVTSQTYSRAYLRHLFKTNEILGLRLATVQNLSFYLRLMTELRSLIAGS